MLRSQIELDYRTSVTNYEAFDIKYSANEVTVETDEVKMVLDMERFEELRDKINKLHEEIN
jgi:hypothetical protein